MEPSRKKYLFRINWLTSSSSYNLIALILVGLILVGFGVLIIKTSIFSSGSTVEVLNTTTESQNDGLEVVVEIAGAVEKPGVYKLHNNSRIEDLLIISGGLSLSADRNWVDKNINRAAKLSDGQKIYIYSSDEISYQSGSESAKENGNIKLYQPVLGESYEKNADLININTASLSELDKLPQIAQERGKKIIEHRPYSTKEELMSKGVIGESVFEKIKDLITL